MTIYVGNLPWSTIEDDLLKLFEPFGKPRKVQIISDRDTGRSRGFGFVELNDDREAENAIEALHGKSYGGRPLTVNEAKPRLGRS